MSGLTGTRDIRGYLRIVWRWKLVFVALLILTPAAFYAVHRGQKPTYQSSALVGINETTVGGATLATGGGAFTTTNVVAIAELVKTTPVARIAADLLHPPADPGQLLAEVTTSSDQVTNFITITAQDRNRFRAAAIANAFARAISINRTAAAVDALRHAIAGVQAQLAGVRKNPAARASLQQQLTQLQGALGTQGSSAAVLQAAAPAGAPTGSSSRRTVEIGLLVGLMLAIAIVAIAENADRRLRTPDDLEELTSLPMLAAIASSAFAGALVTTRRDEEAFQTLRTSLMYLNHDARVRSVMVTSAGEKEGKSTVATRLALAAAGAGMRVILVDADLRRAQTTARLGLSRAPGLADLLSHQAELDQALVDYPLDVAAGGTLRVVQAGGSPPNPAALLSSAEMERVLRRLEKTSDLVIIDTPAALAVSDCMPLIGLVSGALLVARMDSSRRESVRRVQALIAAAHGTILGLVATGVRRGPGYESYASKYYADRPSRDSPMVEASSTPAHST